MGATPGTDARYAVSFCTASGPTAAGALVAAEDRLLLEGRSGEDRIELAIPYSKLIEVRVGRQPEERLKGHPTLLLSYGRGDLVRVAPMGFGLVHELADLLTALATEHADASEEVAVIVPVRKGRVARARELVAEGPPFDPAALGLTRHEVYLTAEEAIFVFAGPHIQTTLERATHDPTFWRVGLAWRGCIGGPPHLTTEIPAIAEEPVYRWPTREAGVRNSSGGIADVASATYPGLTWA